MSFLEASASEKWFNPLISVKVLRLRFPYGRYVRLSPSIRTVPDPWDLHSIFCYWAHGRNSFNMIHHSTQSRKIKLNLYEVTNVCWGRIVYDTFKKMRWLGILSFILNFLRVTAIYTIIMRMKLSYTSYMI